MKDIFSRNNTKWRNNDLNILVVFEYNCFQPMGLLGFFLIGLEISKKKKKSQNEIWRIICEIEVGNTVDSVLKVRWAPSQLCRTLKAIDKEK